MQTAVPSALLPHITLRVGGHARARRVQVIPPTVCQAGRVQLATAALLSSAALQYAIPLEPAVGASVTAVRSPPAGHTLAVKRGLLEDLLMQEVGSRLKSLSDDDLVTVLEQVQQGRFQFPTAAPSLTSSSDALSGDVPPSRSTRSSSDSPLAQSAVERQNATSMPGSSSAIQEGQQGRKQTLPAATSSSEKQATAQQDTAATKSLPEAWQQQTFRLQAFTKPLVQRLQGASSPQASPPDDDSQVTAGQADNDGLLQSDHEQQTHVSQPKSSQPLFTQTQSGQPESSQPASAQQQSGSKGQQEGADSAAGPISRDQVLAQEEPAQGRAVPGQAVSSEELTSSERGLQTVEGSSNADEGTPAGKAGSSSDMGALVEQDASSGEEGSGASSRGQNIDEAEDATTRMLESAGVPLPSTTQNESAVPGAVSQPGRDSSVRQYLGVIWQRTQPQLVLLVIASTISTLAGTVSQFTAARSRQQAAAVPTWRQDQSVHQESGDSVQQISGGQQRLASLRQAILQGLLARLSRKTPSGSRQDEPDQAAPMSGSSQLQAASVPGESGHRHEGVNGLPRRVETNGNGQQYATQEDEWGRPIIQMPVASGNGLHQHSALDVGQSADKSTSKVLWVRQDPEGHESSNGSEPLDNQPDPQTILWQRSQAHNHAAEQADGIPRRFRRSRVGKHEVSIEALLDNVE